MKLTNGYGGVSKLSGKRRKPYIVRVTAGYHFDGETGKQVHESIIVGHTATRKETLEMLADYHSNPRDLETGKVTFKQIYEIW